MAVPILPELKDREAEITAIGDTQYGTGTTRTALIEAGATVIAKAPPDVNSTGGFPKSAFVVDLEGGTATCPAGHITNHVVYKAGRVRFRFRGSICASCPLRSRCTSSRHGRTLNLGPHEELLTEARTFQQTAEFKAIYNGMRPTVERVISRLVRRNGRKARYRGTQRVQEQIKLRASVENLRRMMVLGLSWGGPGGWVLPKTCSADSGHAFNWHIQRPCQTARPLLAAFGRFICCLVPTGSCVPSLRTRSSTAS